MSTQVHVSHLPRTARTGRVTQARVALHELTPKEASLEEAFMDLTREDVEFKAAGLEDEEAAA